jgi:hypothetical protein
MSTTGEKPAKKSGLSDFQFWIIVIAIAGLAVLTKPSQDSFRQKLTEVVSAELASGVADPSDPLAGLIQGICIIGIDSCVNIIMGGVEHTDFVVGRLAVLVDGNGHRDPFVGVFNTWFRIPN